MFFLCYCDDGIGRGGIFKSRKRIDETRDNLGGGEGWGRFRRRMRSKMTTTKMAWDGKSGTMRWIGW